MHEVITNFQVTVEFITNMMIILRLELITGENSIIEINTRRPSVTAIIKLNYILRNCNKEYKFTKSWEKISHFMYMDSLKRFQKNKIGNHNTNGLDI